MNNYVSSLEIEIKKLINLSNNYINGGYKEKKYTTWHIIELNDFNIIETVKNKILLPNLIDMFINNNEKENINYILLTNKDYLDFKFFLEDKYIKSKEIIQKFSKKKNKDIDKLYFHISNQPISNLYRQIGNNSNFNKKKLHFDNFIMDLSKYYYNPFGLWISCGTSWIEYSESFNKQAHDFIYNVRLNNNYKNKVKKITTKSSFSKFAKKYNNKNAKNLANTIEWKKVKNDFDGLIICPYNLENFNKYITNLEDNNINKLFSHYLLESIFKQEILKEKYNLRNEWQRYWDVQSGVIWNPDDIIDEIELIAYWNNDNKEWIKPDKNFQYRIIKPNKNKRS